jgi:hypothetical protein
MLFLFAIDARAESVTAANPPTYDFLTLADIHFYPFTSCDSVTPCPLIDIIHAVNDK